MLVERRCQFLSHDPHGTAVTLSPCKIINSAQGDGDALQFWVLVTCGVSTTFGTGEFSSVAHSSGCSNLHEPDCLLDHDLDCLFQPYAPIFMAILA